MHSDTLVANYVGTSMGFSGRSSLFTFDPIYQVNQPVVANGDREENLPVHFTTLRNDWWINQSHIVASRRTGSYKNLFAKNPLGDNLRRVAEMK